MAEPPDDLLRYESFLARKRRLPAGTGFEPRWLPDWLFGFQRALVVWAVRKGRAALFADCGMGKTPMQLAWARNVVEETGGKRVLVITPASVSSQTVREGEKFKIACSRSIDGELDGAAIVVTNYERLHHFAPEDFAGVVCDESGILKNFAGATRRAITEFMRLVPYRLLATATAAPNDWMELGTSSDALGGLSQSEMLGQFFTHDSSETQKWDIKPHGERSFWRWVCSWARALRKPSDLGFEDGEFVLPPLEVREVLIEHAAPQPGYLFAQAALGIADQRKEKQRTIGERCRRVADLVADTGKPALVWCHLNGEGDELERLIPDAVQVAGRHRDELQEERFRAFVDGEIRVLITKPRIGGWGLNFQHCAHVVTFPSNSFEAYYQTIRRCWRFGQKDRVRVDVVMTEGDRAVMMNLQRKEQQAMTMFENLIASMNDAQSRSGDVRADLEEAMPSWL
ncbi:MAG: helicase-related protein [Dehalococcoidia bacterium]